MQVEKKDEHSLMIQNQTSATFFLLHSPEVHPEVQDLFHHFS